MHNTVIAFVWLNLFGRGLLEAGCRVDGGACADDLARGWSPEKQRKRVRDRLDDMVHRDVPEVLFSRLIVDRYELRLDLTKCSIDIVRLQELAKRCVASGGMLTGDLVAEASRILDETEGEFLSEWDQVASETNAGPGAAAEYVRTLREIAETARVDLMYALATNHMARQEPGKAIPLLEQALDRQPA